MVEGTSTAQRPQNTPVSQMDDSGGEGQAQGAGKGDASGGKFVDNDVVVRETTKMDKELAATEKKMESSLRKMFQDFGIAKPKEGSKLDNIFNLIFELITKMREAMMELKQMAGKKAAQVSVKIFSTTMNGVKEMKEHAQTAFKMAMYSAITSGVGSGVGFVGTGMATRGGGPTMQQDAQKAQAASQLFSSGSKMFDGAGSLAQTDAQAASKEADAQAQFQQSLMQALQELNKDLDGILKNLDSTQQGTMSAQRPRTFA